MKKILFIIVFFLMPSVIFSQVLTQRFAKGEAVRNGLKVNKRMALSNIIEMPSVDVEKLLKEDVEMAGEDVPYRFGYGFETSYTLDNGEWEDEDEGRLWSLRFKSNEAVSLNFVFEDFSLPDGAYLNIVNSDETIVYGPVTSENIPKDGYFLTDIIPDSLVTIYLFEPDSQVGKSTLKIKKVVHGYQNFFVINDDNGDPGSSAPCNIPVENAFPNFEKEANAVALILLEDGTSWCSGSLVISTDLSFKPYLLTAFHCINTEWYPNTNIPTDMVASSAEKANVNHWAIKFGYRQQSTYAITFNGAIFRSGWFDSDFALVELYENAKQFAHLTWLGWDKTGNAPSSGVGIHHPLGDYMKISIDNDPSQTSMWVEAFYPYNGTLHWLEHWDSGIVQGGSSGSPLLNESKCVVGQLHGVIYENGHDDDTLLYYPCLINYASYGKFNLSWIGGGTNDTRLSNWLDPVGTNQSTIDSYHPIIIAGDDIICSYKDYYIQNLPSGASVQWSVSNSNLSIISGQGTGTATFQKNSNGACVITAQVSIGSFTQTVTKNVWAGSPTAPTILGWPSTNMFLANSQYQLYASVNSQAQVSEYQWVVVRGATITSGGNTDSPIFTMNSSGSVRIGVRARNACGWGPYTYMNGGITNDNGQTPINSPGNNIVNIPLPEEGEYEIMLWNTNRLIRTVKTSQSSYDVDLNGLPSDLYIIKVMKDGQSIYQLKVKK